jgi:uncharacterized membrane protein (Fun14 family)
MMMIMNTDTLASMSASIGGGFFAGILIGYALKKVIKMLAIVVGLFIAGLITAVANAATSTMNENSNVAGLAAMSNFGIPLTSSISIGFTIGFMKG